MKVAFATTSGEAVDEHFGRASTFAVYDVTPAGTEFLEMRRVAEGDFDDLIISTRGLGSLHEDAVSAKIGKLDDVKIVYFSEIGGPSAAKLVRAGIMPLKAAIGTGIASAADRLVETMRTNPAPWMRRVLAEEVSASPEDQ
ncbi:MAG: NifB/NifX family molybdenum-iron cluster-binding protein [Coriobacteriia bacterium]